MTKPSSPYENIAVVYDMIRPEYPNNLIQDIVKNTGICSGEHILEIGAGTGKATKAFLDLGFQVDALELEENMAALLRDKRNCSQLRVYVDSFEAWSAPRQDYPLIVCAQAFHWLDPELKFEKCQNLLSDGGYLALFWYDPLPVINNVLHQKLEEIKTKYLGESLTSPSADPVKRELELENTPLFEMCFKQTYDFTLQNTPDMYMLAMKSTPAFSEKLCALSEKEQDAFIAAIESAIQDAGGYVECSMHYSLYLLKAAKTLN